MTVTTLAQAIEERRILVVCGAGGVGKTSVSAALALAAARKRKTIVLTIDPAKRLASALGLGGRLGHDARVVETGGLTLSAAMLDMKRAWDELVRRYAPSEQVASRIEANALYRGLSQHFVGSHGYMAMERLAELHERGDYDLIVVDTPPTRRALDFLDAPRRMTDFVGGSLLRWFAKPYAAAGRLGARAFHLTASPLLKVADRVLGSQILEELAEFVLDFQTLYDDFKERAASVLELLHDRRTGFVVVTTLEAPPLEEAGYFLDRLADERLPVAGLVANRVAPATFAGPDASRSLDALRGAGEPAFAAIGDATGVQPRDVADVMAWWTDALGLLTGLSRRDAVRTAELSRRARLPVTSVPLLGRDVCDLDSLGELAAYLES